MESNSPSIQWFPGHMAKTRRIMRESMRLVDIVVELRDARIPYSSGNPEIRKLVGDKPRAVILNKSDIADPEATKQWREYYEKNKVPLLAANCRSGKGLNGFEPLIKTTLATLLERRAAKGMAGRPVRMMFVGIPNVGKSSLINRLAGGRRAKVEDRPGVTRGKQWVKIEGGFELLDMPGVLWPKFDDATVAENLAFTGAIKDDIMDMEALAARLLERLVRSYPAQLQARYKIEQDEIEDIIKTSAPSFGHERLPDMQGDGRVVRGFKPLGHEMLALIGKKRGMLVSGGGVNTERAAITVLDEFRGGQIGRVTLELPR